MPEQLASPDLDVLLDLVRAEGFRVIGPTVQDGAIVYDEVRARSDLPLGWTDEQAPGHYRLRARDDDAAFGYVVGPHSWKRFLFPPHEELIQIGSREGTSGWRSVADEGEPLCFLGVRGCELAAMGVQDRVFMGGPFVDERYKARRDRCLIIAVDCTEAGALCFCDSMGTGPAAQGDHDLRLTELGGSFLVEAGSDQGQALLDKLPTQPASSSSVAEAEAAIERCRTSMGRKLDTEELGPKLMGNLDHERWLDVAERCLACANCTAVCPTCFCHDIVDTSELGGDGAGRTRTWDSCFTAEHSSIHGAQFRPDVRSRYQQWMTHKLATWTSQFGTSGCVGCGRCIAWCPVGIDLVEEANTIAKGDAPPVALPPHREHEVHEEDPLLPRPVRVLEVARETRDVVTLFLEPPEGYQHEHGQFNMLSLPGIGDVPISISASRPDVLEHTIRGVGPTTRALIALKAGDVLGLRGPFGSCWPLDDTAGRDVVLIAGGLGMAPLRSTVRALTSNGEARSIRLLYGTRSPEDILFQREVLGWVQSGSLRAHVTVDQGGLSWTGNVGVVTKLMRRKRLPKDGLYFVCGPEIMMRYTLAELEAIGVPKANIYLSMERNMKCAAGHCGRCQYGPYFICKDGPVFRYDQIDFLFGRSGF